VDLAGRHVVITGGSRGLGAAMAREFASADARVTLVARTERALAEVAVETGAAYVVADLRSPDDLIARLEQDTPIDVLVNNAGIDEIGSFVDIDAATIRDVFTINAIAPAELARQAVPGMVARGGGRLVFISSLSAQVAMPGLAVYSATKAALSQLAEGLRVDLAGTGVGVTSVEIGTIATDMYESIKAYPAGGAAFARMIRLGFLRLLRADEVARAVVTACQKDKGSVVLPRRARTQVALGHLPQRVTNRLTWSV
jgi:short-subunit dehydrogenase